ncbi:MAG TPA: FecR domain-containing protein [Burkholderiales bacterium]|nr:FecR domain-containing protein [Burkholderiales bacterium]
MSALNRTIRLLAWVALAAGSLVAAPLAANDIAQIKTLSGTVLVERGSQRILGSAGMKLQQADVIRTGIDGSVGITFVDNTIMSAGPNSSLTLDKFSFNSTTHEGRLDASIRSGTLSVISGKIAKQSPEAMTVRTPSAILGARGTEFFVQVVPLN